MDEHIDKDGIPTQIPNWGATATFDSKNRTLTDYDWKEFHKMDREKQIDVLEFLLDSLRELPESLERARNNSSLDAGLKSG